MKRSTDHPAQTTADAQWGDAVHEAQEALDSAHQRRLDLIAEIRADAEAVDSSDLVARRRHESRQARRQALEAADDRLVFGRLEDADGAVIHLGRIGLPDEDEDAAPILVDWRARQARAFYTATPVDPQGLRARRHIRSEGRYVIAVDDEPLELGHSDSDLVGEGALLAALDERRTGAMATAVATLQREQDSVIRADARGPHVVQGGPGTGKTVVALHRVAYLLFDDDALARSGVLVLGPNRRFLDYIASVIPALGETAVVATTCDSLLPGVAVTRRESREVAEIEGRALWQEAIRQHLDSLLPDPIDLVVDLDGERHVIPREQVARAWTSSAAAHDLHAARRALTSRLVEVTVDLIVADREGALTAVEEGFEDVLAGLDSALARSDTRAPASQRGASDVDGTLDDDDIERLRDRLVDSRSVEHAVQRFLPDLDAQEVLASLLGSEELLAAHAGLEPDERRLIVEDRRGANGWSSSEVALLDSLAELIGDAAPPPQVDGFVAERAAATRDWIYGHVVVDEAQELSPMQWRMVRRRCPSRSITAVGDIDQTESPHRGERWEDRLAGVLGDRWARSELTHCYRTPREVMEIASAALAVHGGPSAPLTAVRSATVDPWQIVVEAARLGEVVAQAVAGMAERWPGGTVGVIAPPKLVASIVPGLPEGVWAGTATESKGLEWDAAVVVDPAGIAAGPRGANQLYVALSRCTQELGRIHLVE